MKQIKISKYLMILITICSLLSSTPTSSFTMPNQLTKFFATPYGKPVCFVVCAYLAVRTVGYLISDGEDTGTTSQTNSSNNNNYQEPSMNPVSLACLASIAASLTNNVIDSTFKLWGNESGVPEYDTVEDIIKGQKPLEKLVGSAREEGIEIYNSIMARHINNRPTTNHIVYGEMGCGKTELMKAVACKLYEEIGADALFVSGGIFNTEYSGEGAKIVRALIKETIKRTESGTRPVLLCIDEIDSIGNRNTTDKGVTQSQSQTINELMASLSKIKRRYPITLIGATNYIERVSSGIKRRGAPPRKVGGFNNKKDKYNYIKEMLKEYSINPSVRASEILKLVDKIHSPGFIEEMFELVLDKARNGNPKTLTLKNFVRAAKECSKHYKDYNKNEPKVERNEFMERGAFNDYIRKKTGLSSGEAEDLEREITGFDGNRMFGKGGLVSTNQITKDDIWEEKQRQYARNQEDRSTKHLELSNQQHALAIKGEQRTDEQEARNRELHQISRRQEERAQWNEKFRNERLEREREQYRHSKEAHENHKAILELGISSAVITGVGTIAAVITGPATWSAAAATFFWTAGPTSIICGGNTVHRNSDTIKRWFGF